MLPSHRSISVQAAGLHTRDPSPACATRGNSPGRESCARIEAPFLRPFCHLAKRQGNALEHAIHCWALLMVPLSAHELAAKPGERRTWQTAAALLFQMIEGLEHNTGIATS